MRPLKKKYYWSRNLAYAIGLIATDGCLSKDGRHIDLTSKDIEQLYNFCACLGLNNKVGYKTSGYTGKKYTRIQFGDVTLYRFLVKIGLTPNKTKSIAALKIPDKYFIDFLRGSLDGDGCTYSYWDPRWRSSFMLYTTFISASEAHIKWIRDQIEKLYHIKGIYRVETKSIYSLRYAKKASIKLLEKIYYKKNLICLTRKRLKIEESLGIIQEEKAQVEKLENSLP